MSQMKCGKCHKSFEPFIIPYKSPDKPEHRSRTCKDCRKNNHILTTGCYGLIGSRIHKKYRTNGVDVATILNMPRYNSKLIIHCGAMTKISESIRNPLKYFRWNVESTFRVFEACRKHDADIIFFSSSRVLAGHNNPYTASKAYGEELCKAYNECYGINYKIVRPSTVYGPGDKNRLIPIFIERARQNLPLVIYGDKSKALNFTYIDDFLDAFDLIYKKGEWNTDYNVGGQTRNVWEVAQYIIYRLNSKSQIVYEPPEIAQPQNVSFDETRVRGLGYNPTITLNEGIDKILYEPKRTG